MIKVSCILIKGLVRHRMSCMYSSPLFLEAAHSIFCQNHEQCFESFRELASVSIKSLSLEVLASDVVGPVPVCPEQFSGRRQRE